MQSHSQRSDAHPASERLAAPLHMIARWWRMRVSGTVDHAGVVEQVRDDSGWSPRYAFMTLMSAGIAVLGLLLSSPAVVIGAMLISPLMGPIMGLGFSLALFDFREMRRSITALAIAALLAVAFTGLVVLVSPLKAATAEILARTRPNLFDLLVALFSALAGTFALIRGRGATIVGVAIATALMPPLATVGFGLATTNLAIAGGAFALFGTNFVTIALSATIMARLYGFGPRLSSQQSWLQTFLLLGVFLLMAVPLGISLNRIAREAIIATQVRSVLGATFGQDGRVTQLDIDYEADPIAIRAVIVVPKSRAVRADVLQREVEAKLHQPVSLRADQLLVDPTSTAVDQERAAFVQAQDQQKLQAKGSEVAQLLAVAAGGDPSAVTIDRDARRAIVSAQPLPGATLATYRALEQRVAGQEADWEVAIVPPANLPLLPVRFAEGVDTPDEVARVTAITNAWAATRWNWPALAVPGLTEPMPDGGSLVQRRAAAVATLLRAYGVMVVSAPSLARPGNNVELAQAVAEQ